MTLSLDCSSTKRKSWISHVTSEPPTTPTTWLSASKKTSSPLWRKHHNDCQPCLALCDMTTAPFRRSDHNTGLGHHIGHLHVILLPPQTLLQRQKQSALLPLTMMTLQCPCIIRSRSSQGVAQLPHLCSGIKQALQCQLPVCCFKQDRTCI